MTDIEILRQVLARELETINTYAVLAEKAKDPRVKNLLMHIARDEEEHVAECIQWLTKLNPIMATFLERDLDHIEKTNKQQMDTSDYCAEEEQISEKIKTSTAIQSSWKASEAEVSERAGTRFSAGGHDTPWRTPETEAFEAKAVDETMCLKKTGGVAAPGGGILLTPIALTVGKLGSH